jgi:hypothetical protein
VDYPGELKPTEHLHVRPLRLAGVDKGDADGFADPYMLTAAGTKKLDIAD